MFFWFSYSFPKLNVPTEIDASKKKHRFLWSKKQNVLVHRIEERRKPPEMNFILLCDSNSNLPKWMWIVWLAAIWPNKSWKEERSSHQWSKKKRKKAINKQCRFAKCRKWSIFAGRLIVRTHIHSNVFDVILLICIYIYTNVFIRILVCGVRPYVLAHSRNTIYSFDLKRSKLWWAWNGDRF